MLVIDDGRVNPFITETTALEVGTWKLTKQRIVGVLTGLLAISLILVDNMVDDWGRLSKVGNLIKFIEESLWPPDWSVMEPQTYQYVLFILSSTSHALLHGLV